MTRTTYRRIVVSRRGAPDVLETVEEPIPQPKPGEALVKVQTAGVSAYDVMLRSKWFPGFPRLPYFPGVDVVGVVDQLGDGVSTVEAGQMVAASTGHHGGGYAEYICLPEHNLVAVPPGVDPAQAVSVVANYMTAHLAMHETAEVKSGVRILVQGAAGGVGTALLELGKLAGLEMYGTASRHNFEVVSGLGATPIDYRNEDFVQRIRQLTGDGVDVVFDPIGGARQLWRSYRALRRNGRLVWFGVAASARSGIKVIPLSVLTKVLLSLIPDGKQAPFMKNAGTKGSDDKTWYRDTLTELLDHLAAGKIAPVVADRIPLPEAPRAHELLEHGEYAGKVVLVTQ
jgi:NADPH:quinone reductase-like Zn-dependent oxidoreductase